MAKPISVARFISSVEGLLGPLSQGMAAVTGDQSYEDYYQIGWTNLVAVANGMGAAAYTVTTTDELTAALGQALAGANNPAGNVPQVIVATIDASEAPPYDYTKHGIAPPA